VTNGVSEFLREMLVDMGERLRWLEQRLKRYDLRIATLARGDERAARLMKVEGVGPLIATALIAAVGDARQFHRERELSAWLGLVPRQHSSGGHTMLLAISKRGDRSLRTLLIHGARSMLHRVRASATDAASSNRSLSNKQPRRGYQFTTRARLTAATASTSTWAEAESTAAAVARASP
jgi:transposase